MPHTLNVWCYPGIEFTRSLNCFFLRRLDGTRSFRSRAPDGIVALRSPFNIDAFVCHVIDMSVVAL